MKQNFLTGEISLMIDSLEFNYSGNMVISFPALTGTDDNGSLIALRQDEDFDNDIIGARATLPQFNWQRDNGGTGLPTAQDEVDVATAGKVYDQLVALGAVECPCSEI